MREETGLEYTLPIRIRWDVDFRGKAERTKRVARQIREAGPLMVEVRIEGEAGLSHLPAIFNEIHKCDACIEATIRYSPGAPTALRWRYPIGLVWEVDGTTSFRRELPPGSKSVAFTPDEENYPQLPDVLEAFADSALEALHLPNVNAVRALAAKGHVPVPRPGQIREAAEILARHKIPLDGKRLVVHDFFLWKALRDIYPGETGKRVEFSGCQAGSALAYVDWDGNVYPCDSLAIRLGSLLESPLEQVWRSPARQQILAAIRSAPAPCNACDLLHECQCGCRGLAHASSDSFDAPDPSCAGSPTGASPEGEGKGPSGP